ncbi:MAG TPA: CvpA family protein [Gallionellaceae bacterium]
MTAFDFAVLAVVALSMLLGWWRGLVYEAVSLLNWVAAYFVARLFAPDIVDYVPATMGAPSARMAVAFSALFALTLVVGGVLAWGMNKLVKSSGLERLDGSLGTVFGLVRGCFLVLVLVLLAGMTSLPTTSAWRDALMSGALEEVAVQARGWLPEVLAQKIHFHD